MEASLQPTDATLSFLGCVNIAVRLARQAYPDAQLYEAQTHAANPGHPSPLKDLRVVFQVQGGQGTAILTMTQWGEFGPIWYVDKPWVEDIVIQWPINMDIVAADQLLKQAGYPGPYGAVTLRHPLYPGDTEPYYIFSMYAGGYVFVGVNDGKVTPQPAAAPAAAAA